VPDGGAEFRTPVREYPRNNSPEWQGRAIERLVEVFSVEDYLPAKR
jgi:hypothetical protein